MSHSEADQWLDDRDEKAGLRAEIERLRGALDEIERLHGELEKRNDTEIERLRTANAALQAEIDLCKDFARG